MGTEQNNWRDFWLGLPEQEKERIAEKAGCCVLHLRNIAYGMKPASPKLAKNIELACGFPKEVMRPDIWG
ncbi:hypothetical protein [Vibrio harveyi]|uniref:hypothetical protein n=1 Tax=Vibrio harveyi TaxID=669 RepID=UPI00165E01E0|nr:hypothetical protein [Vibrio harveyi]